MDLLKCGAISSVEVLLLLRAEYIQQGAVLYTFFALFSQQYLALKLFHILVWPFYFSPLRHLPGPKV